MYIIDKHFLNADDLDFFNGRIDKETDEIFYEKLNLVVNNTSDFIEQKFQLDYKLYLDNSQVRSYVTNESKNGMDWHQDHLNWFNKVSQTWILCEHRLFTSIINLNSDFLGGVFEVATETNNFPAKRIFPKDGQLVAIPSSVYHGVEPLIAGMRHVIIMWWRMDQKSANLRDLHLNDLPQWVEVVHQR